MFFGQSRYNATVFGWSGHMKNGSVFETGEMLDAVTANWSKIVESIGGSSPSQSMTWSWSKHQQVLQCTYVDSKIFQNQEILNGLLLKFYQIQNVSLNIFVSDRLTKVSRTLQSNYETYSGPPIGTLKLGEPSLKKFYFTLEQTEYSPEVMLNDKNLKTEKYICSQ